MFDVVLHRFQETDQLRPVLHTQFFENIRFAEDALLIQQALESIIADFDFPWDRMEQRPGDNPPFLEWNRRCTAIRMFAECMAALLPDLLNADL